jgi:hypothetical protein
VVGWGQSGLQILGTVLASGLLVSGFTIFYSDFYKKPDIRIKIIPNDKDGRKSSIEVTNKGREPATNFILKIAAPRKIISSIPFSTDYIKLNRTGSNTLEANLPRFVQGLQVRYVL